MARLPLPDPDDPAVDAATRELLGSLRSLTPNAAPPNVLTSMANHPRIARAFLDFATVAYYTVSLTPAHRELAYLSASVANRCHY